ncbi:hypothetical protein Gpo141_00014009 [Globisporangium polare]
MNVLKVCAAALVASLGLATLTTTTVNAAPCAANKTLAANKVLVADALDAFFNKRNASAVDTYIGSEYLQHNPGVPDGADDLKAFIGTFKDGSKFELGTQAADTDLVWTHGRYTGIPGLPVMIIVDIFRMKDGKAVEHWDISQKEVPANETASGRPMFPIVPSATPTPIVKGCSDNGASTPACESKETLDANKKLAADALDAFFNKRDISAVDKYIGAEYLQHNPGVPDGADDLKSFISTFNSSSKFELGVQVAEADLVWTHGRYTDIPGMPVMVIVDVFRVKDSKLVEHWDIAQQEVPAAQTASGRPMFPIED